MENTTNNAARSLEAFGAPSHIKVYPGAAKPIIGQPHPAADIHGNDGLGGVEGLPEAASPQVQERIVTKASDSGLLPALAGLVEACKSVVKDGRKLHIGVTGACTNIALFLLSFPELAKEAVEQIVMMGGGVGIGNSEHYPFVGGHQLGLSTVAQ